MNLNPFIILISQIIYLYNIVIVIYCVIGWLVNFGILSARNRYVSKISYACARLVDPLLDRIRKYLPDLGGIDISPIIAILGMIFIKNILFTYFFVR